MESRLGRARIVVCVTLVGAVAAACRGKDTAAERPATQTVVGALAAPVSAEASALLAELRARPGSPLEGGVAESFDADAGGFKPRFAAAVAAAEPAPARVTLPQQATAPLHVEDVATSVAIDVALRNAAPVAAQAADGYVVYPGALSPGTVALHRAVPGGSEDFVSFETKPATTDVAYDVTLGAGASGLRLVAGTLEIIDATGAPRLHVAPPYIVGADGTRTDATLAVAGCAVDTNPAAPWGRAVTAPGARTCQVRVSWPGRGVTYPAILDPRWTTTGSMTTARQEHTATLLSNGKVLVAGGRSSTGTTALASAELFDRSTGTWAATGSMTGARRLHTATQLNTSGNPTTSGKVLVAGGINGSTTASTAQLYSPTAGTWAAAANLNAARHGHTATLLADGKVLAAGGLNGTTTLATAAIYNPASGSGSWTATTGPIPPPGLKAHTATLIQTSNQQLNNKVLLVGGNSGSAAISAVYLFDPAQSAFSTLASIPSPREQHTAVVLPNANGKILVAGGKNGSTVLSSAIVFDPGFGPGSWSSAGTMTSARVGHSMTVLPQSIVANGSVLVAGGSSTGSNTLSSAELFSGTSTWTSTPAMPSAMKGHAAVLLGDNMVLTAGGLDGSTVVSAAHLYDASFGLACTSASQCPTGFCVDGVCCDSACNGGCGACNLAGSLGTCSPRSAGTICRAATDACDAAETCSGSSLSCPADGKAPNGTGCNDGNGCTLTDTCQSGTCIGTNPRLCQAWDQCHAPGTCDSATGRCSNPAATDGTACNDGNTCTGSDVCVGGTCDGTATCTKPIFSTITDLGAIYANDGSVAMGINAASDVVGTESDSASGWQTAWRFTDASGQQAITQASASGTSEGAGINEARTVVGTLRASTAADTFGFSAAPGATATNVTAANGSAAGVNNTGQIAATEPGAGGLLSAFRRTGNTKTFVGALTGTRFSGATTARGIGPAGQVVGEALTTEDFRDFPDGTHFAPDGGVREAFAFTDAQGIRNLNDDPLVTASSWQLLYTAKATNGPQIVGWGLIGGLRHAFRYTPGSGIDDLGTLFDAAVGTDVTGHYSAEAINGRGDIVGTVYDPNPSRAFYFSDATGIIDLNDLLDPTLGFTLVTASGINDQHEIVGSYLIDGDTRRHAYRMKLPDVVVNAAGPLAAITPRMYGICDVGLGKFIAVFGYDSAATQNVKLAYGTVDNVFVDGGTVSADPSPAPPTWYLPGSYPGAFLPIFSSGETLSWTLAGKTVVANDASTPLTCGPPAPGSSGLVTTINGVSVTIRRDPGAELAGSVMAADISTPNSTLGTLEGRLDVNSDGAATYHVPIWMPNAPLQPNIALDYNSGNEESFTGVGFRLTGFSEIVRCRAAYAQDPPIRPESSVNFSTTDHLCFDGRILISTSGTPWTEGAEYRPDNDPFTRVRQHVTSGVSGGTYFEVFRRDGTIETYGQAPASVVFSAQGMNGQYSWAINKKTDRSQNLITYDYEVISSTGLVNEPGTLNERVPRGVHYGAAAGSPLPYEISFPLTATTPRISYVGGYKMQSTWLLTGIDVRGPNPVASSIVRHYAISYDTPTISDRQLISTIKECDGASVCKPPTTFTWEPGDMKFRDIPVAVNMTTSFGMPRLKCCNYSELAVGPRYFHLATGDVDGDGRDDLIYQLPINGISIVYRLSTGNGFGPVQSVPGSAINPNLDDTTLTHPSTFMMDLLIADIDLDGAAEIKIHNGNGPSANPAFRSIVRNAIVPAGDAVTDMNGDGLPDYVKADQQFACVEGACDPGSMTMYALYNLMTAANAPLPFNQLLPAVTVDPVTGRPSTYNWSVQASPGTVNAAGFQFPPIVDMNGDGASEVLAFGAVRYGPIGGGATGLPTPGLNPDPIRNQKSELFADVNGDGLPDCLAIDSPKSGEGLGRIYMNTGFRAGGGGFIQGGQISNFQDASWVRGISFNECEEFYPDSLFCDGALEGTDMDEANAIVGTDPGLRVADFNGDGRQDILSFAARIVSMPSNSQLAGINLASSRYAGALVNIHKSNGGGFIPEAVQVVGGTTVKAGLPGPFGFGGADPPHFTGIGHHTLDRVLDANGDGLPDFTTVQERNDPEGIEQIHVYVHEGKKPDLLVSVTNGLGATDTVEYDHLGNRDSTTYTPTPPGTCTYPQYCVNKAMWVVSKVHRDAGGAVDGTQTEDFRYQYRDARTDVQGLGWIGFAGTTVINELTGEKIDTTYGNAFSRFTTSGGVSSYPQARLPTSVTHDWQVDAVHLLRRTGTYSYAVGSAGEVFLTSDIEEDQESFGPDFLTKTRTTASWEQYDQYGNARHRTEHVEQRDDRFLDIHSVLLRTVDATYDNDPTSWLLGLKRTATTRLQTFGEGAEDITRNESWDYVSGTRLVAHAIREPNGPADLRVTTTFGRNSRGLTTRITRTDSSGTSRVTDIGYDPIVGHLAESFTQGGLTVTTRRHPTFGVVTRASDPNGVGASYVHDTFGRTKIVTPDLAGQKILTYSPVFDSSRTFAIDEFTEGEPERIGIYDRLARQRVSMRQRLDGDTFSAIYTDYDGVGRISRVSTPLAYTSAPQTDGWLFTNYEYDGASRLTSTHYPAEGVDVTVPPGVPNPTPIITPKPSGQVLHSYDWLSTYQYHLDQFGVGGFQLIGRSTTDALGNVTATAYTDPATARSVTTSFRYGAAQSITKVTDSAGNETSMVYDAWGRRTTLVDPDIGTIQTTYNAFDDALTDTSARGTTIHGLDDLGRSTGDSGPDGVSTLVWDLEPNGLGRPSSATSPDQIRTSWAYDAASRVRATTWTVPGEPAPLTIQRNRDEFGRVSSIVYPPSGMYNLTAVYGYSPVGYLASVGRLDGTAVVPLWTVDERAVDGQIERETFGDGPEVAQTQTFRNYSFTGKLIGLVTNSFPAGERLHSASYDYDGLGRLKSRATDTFGDTYQYDFMDRLQVWNHANSAWTEMYDYDDIGNLRHHSGSDTSGLQLDETYTFGGSGAGPHAVTTGPDGAYTYDEIGNQKSAPGRTVTFWEFGLPRQVTKAGVVTSFKYDAARTRVVKSNNQGDATISLSQLYEKRTASGQTTYANYVIAESGVVAQVNVDALGNRHIQELHDDHLGSPVLVTDENGVASTIDFDPWGLKVTYDANGRPIGVNMSVPGLRIGFTGHDEDDDLELVNMRGRIYDPRQRRFISPDPFVPMPFNGQSYNRYAYVLNNPLNLVDPSGFDGEGGDGDGYAVAPVPGAPAGSTAATGIKGGTGYSGTDHGKGGKGGPGFSNGAKGSGGDGDAFKAMLSQPAIPGYPDGGPKGGGIPGGVPNGNSTNPSAPGHAPGTGNGPGTSPGAQGGPGPGSNADSVGGFGPTRGGSPTGSTAPNAAPNGVQNPDLNLFGQVFQYFFPNTTINPDTLDEIEGALLVLQVVVPVVAVVVKEAGIMENVVQALRGMKGVKGLPGKAGIPVKTGIKAGAGGGGGGRDRIRAPCGRINPGTLDCSRLHTSGAGGDQSHRFRHWLPHLREHEPGNKIRQLRARSSTSIGVESDRAKALSAVCGVQS